MSLLRKSLLILALMIGASALALVLRPTHKIADQQPAIDLNTLVPRQFGEWREEPQNFVAMINPQQKEVLDKIYNQTLSRTYINAQGYRIMLSIAYGGDQSDAMQVHKPEVCYPSQGFQMLGKTTATIDSPAGQLMVTRVDTKLGARREPVTYWTTIGNQVVHGGIHKKLVEMSYGLSGRIPDGLLFRVSSVDTEVTHAYGAQDSFINQLLSAVTPAQRQRLAGTPES
jgi:EpsI family protein